MFPMTFGPGRGSNIKSFIFVKNTVFNQQKLYKFNKKLQNRTSQNILNLSNKNSLNTLTKLLTFFQSPPRSNFNPTMAPLPLMLIVNLTARSNHKPNE